MYNKRRMKKKLGNRILYIHLSTGIYVYIYTPNEKEKIKVYNIYRSREEYNI